MRSRGSWLNVPLASAERKICGTRGLDAAIAFSEHRCESAARASS
jgi:hypothetical protein